MEMPQRHQHDSLEGSDAPGILRSACLARAPAVRWTVASDASLAGTEMQPT
jgi:hypothetical protein